MNMNRMLNFNSSLALFNEVKICLDVTPYAGTISSRLNDSASPPFLKNSVPPAFITFKPKHFVVFSMQAT